MTLHHLQRPGGRIAWTSTGSGPLVLLVPGMGDTRATWRDLVGPLSASHRVVTTDLRGHGESDTTFTRQGDEMTAHDVLALVEHLNQGPAVLVGNSMGASSSVWAAAERPDLVAGLVLVSPFLLVPRASWVSRTAMHTVYRLLFARPWGAAMWARYYAGPLSAGRRSDWQAAHVATLRSEFSRPDRLRSLRRLAVQLDHTGVAERTERVREAGVPSLVVIGEHDPDYRDPAAELARDTEALGADGLLVADTAHYPHHQAPRDVLPAVEALLAALPAEGGRWASRGA